MKKKKEYLEASCDLIYIQGQKKSWPESQSSLRPQEDLVILW